LRYQDDNCTIYWAFLNCCKILQEYQNSMEMGEYHSFARNSTACR